MKFIQGTLNTPPWKRQTNRKREILTICSRVERKIKITTMADFLFSYFDEVDTICMHENQSELMVYVWNASMFPATTAFRHKNTAWKNFNHLFFVMNTANIIIMSRRLYVHFHLSLLTNWINKKHFLFLPRRKKQRCVFWVEQLLAMPLNRTFFRMLLRK